MHNFKSFIDNNEKSVWLHTMVLFFSEDMNQMVKENEIFSFFPPIVNRTGLWDMIYMCFKNQLG